METGRTAEFINKNLDEIDIDVTNELVFEEENVNEDPGTVFNVLKN